jgi:DNA-binding MarR family transcriptional regulator
VETPKPVSEHLTGLHAERLRQLSEEVGRLAATLARLAMDAGQERQGPEPGPDAKEIPAELVTSVIQARRQRTRYFSKNLFADPAWDMLLDLFQAEILQRRVSVSSLCIAAAVPGTTALRWLKLMVERGLLIRRPDPIDLRRVYVELAPETSEALRRYFAELAAGGDA